MRLQVTRKRITENYFCISAGYCELQALLTYCTSPYYTAGIYGWNFDVYPFEYNGCNVAICTGYRGMPGKHFPYSVLNEFELRAETIKADAMGEKKERLNSLIQEFLKLAFPEIVGGK